MIPGPPTPHGPQAGAPKSPAQSLVEMLRGIHSTNEYHASFLKEIEEFNGQTEALSESVNPTGYNGGRVAKLCLLSIVGSKMRKGDVFLPIAEKLVAAGADLHKLSEKILPHSLEWCIDRRQDENRFGLSPLAYCFAYSEHRNKDTANGVLDFAKLLMEAGVDIAQDPTAFVLACLRYDAQLVEYLLKNGADANSKLPNGMPVSLVLVGKHCRSNYVAANEERSLAENKLSKREHDMAESKLSKREPWIRMIRLLLEHGADPAVVFPWTFLPSAKFSLLSGAIAVGDVGFSKELLNMDVPLVHYDKDTFLYTQRIMPMCGSLTPLNECLARIAQGQEEMLEVFYILLDKGADLKAGGTGSHNHMWNPTLLCTAIGCAKATGGNAALREVVSVMLDKGVDIKEEEYALCLAAISLDTELFEMLLKKGFDTEDCRSVDAAIPTLGPNRFQLPKEKTPGGNGRYVVTEVKVSLLLFLLRNVPPKPETEDLVLDMVECLLRNGVDLDATVGPTKNMFNEKVNGLKLALQHKHMSAAMLLVKKGIALKVDEDEEYSIFRWALLDNKDLKTATFLLAHATTEILNSVDQKGLTPLGYAACLHMYANIKLVEPSDENNLRRRLGLRAHEGETDEQRQRREKYEEQQRKYKEEQEARHAAEDAEVEDLIQAMLDAGASPFVLQADKDWDSRHNLTKASLFEICARRQRWRQLEIVVTHSLSSSGRSKDFRGPLIMALAARADPRIIRMLLDLVDSVVKRFVFQKSTYSKPKQKKEEDSPPRVVIQPLFYGTSYSVRTGMSVLSCAGGSRLENLKCVLERAEQEKAPVNAKDENGNTALSVLLMELPKKSEDGVKLLLEAGADPSIKTGPKAVDSLMLASARTDLSRSLPSNGSMWSNSYDLPSQLKFFAERRSAAVLQLLRDRGSLFSAKDKDGKTAFHYACHSGCTKLVEWYLDTFTEEEAAKYINLALPESGMTPVMLISSVRGMETLIPRFVTVGADPSAVAKNGHTALSLAVVTRATKATVVALLENGADPNKGPHPLIAATKQNPRVWDLIHKLIDDLDINQATAQEALNYLLSVTRNGDDPYGDFRIRAMCGFGAGQEMRGRQQRAQQETQSITEKLVGLGANLKLAQRAAQRPEPTAEDMMGWFIRWHFLS